MNANEYLPTPEEHAEQQQRSRLERILKTRRDALEMEGNKSGGISDAAKVAFVWALDVTLNREANSRYGVAAISIYGAVQALKKSKKAILKAKKELIQAGLIWISKGHCPGRWPIDLWNIEALNPRRAAASQTMLKGVWGNGVEAPLPKTKHLEKTELGRFAPKDDPHGVSKTPTDRRRKRRRTVGENGPSRRRKRRRTVGENAARRFQKQLPPVGENADGPWAKTPTGHGRKRRSKPLLLVVSGTEEKEGGKGTPPLKASPHHPEKILWEGKAFWPSELQKNLSRVEGEIATATGPARETLRAKRRSIMLALGLTVPQTKTPAPAALGKVVVVKPVAANVRYLNSPEYRRLKKEALK